GEVELAAARGHCLMTPHLVDPCSGEEYRPMQARDALLVHPACRERDPLAGGKDHAGFPAAWLIPQAMVPGRTRAPSAPDRELGDDVVCREPDSLNADLRIGADGLQHAYRIDASQELQPGIFPLPTEDLVLKAFVPLARAVLRVPRRHH